MKFNDLRAKLSPEAQERARQQTQAMLAELPLHVLRKARDLSQQTLAQALGASQPQVSKIEHRTDLYVSTLRKYIEALGGELEIVARFPEGSVRVNLFQEIGGVAVGSSTASIRDVVFSSVPGQSKRVHGTVDAQLGSLVFAVEAKASQRQGGEARQTAQDTQPVLAA